MRGICAGMPEIREICRNTYRGYVEIVAIGRDRIDADINDIVSGIIGHTRRFGLFVEIRFIS